jgi:hypothetical protein
MFVQSEKFVESHGGRIGDIAMTPSFRDRNLFATSQAELVNDLNEV